jgi:hypothetical protein
LFVPDLFGNPAHGDYWGYATYWEDATYLGLLGILLALRNILRRDKTQEDKSLTRFLIGIFLVSLLFALGNNTPFFPWLYHNVPTFDMFQAPARYLIWSQFALAMMAGLGMFGWQRPEERALYWSRLGTMSAFAVMVGAGFGSYLLRQSDLSFGEIQPTFIPAFARAGLWGLGIGALNLLAPPRDNPEPKLWWQWAVAGWLALDLLVAGWGLNPSASLDVYQEANGSTASTHSRILFEKEGLQHLMYDRFLRFDSFEIDEPWQNLRQLGLPGINILDGRPVANNFDPLVPGRYAQWMATLAEAPPEAQSAMITRMDISQIISSEAQAPYAAQFSWVTSSVPRVRWVGCGVNAVDETAALALVQSGKVDRFQSVILEDTGQVACTEDVQPALISLIYTPNEVEIKVQAEADGYVVLADTWYPGWRANVDEESTEILHADYLFRAVYVPAGMHTVQFVFSPLSFYLGLGLSLLGWSALSFFWRRANG